MREVQSGGDERHGSPGSEGISADQCRGHEPVRAAQTVHRSSGELLQSLCDLVRDRSATAQDDDPLRLQARELVRDHRGQVVRVCDEQRPTERCRSRRAGESVREVRPGRDVCHGHRTAEHLGADAGRGRVPVRPCVPLARTLAELEKALRDSGYLQRGSDGSLRLSPKAMRRLGKELLRDATDRLSARQGQRDSRLTGAAGERSGSSREWQFGDTEPWDVTRTVTNALVRTVSEGGEPGQRIRIDIRDVEVTETEARTRSAVALLVDTSFSMAMDGRWVPMKRTALALHQLISSRFRGDHLSLIAFGRLAQTMDIEELTALDALWDKGTNLHHALLLANRHFRKHSGDQPVLLIVTDGEPTAHLMADGHSWFDYPPHPLTIAKTVEELDAARRLGAQTTFFRLGEDPGLGRFVDQMARRVGACHFQLISRPSDLALTSRSRVLMPRTWGSRCTTCTDHGSEPSCGERSSTRAFPTPW
ncbi:MAG TPA: VWA domain-containing protein [Brevibacterium sp.]|nr:VWA domain-containing protein [Brevibacterium sp.]